MAKTPARIDPPSIAYTYVGGDVVASIPGPDGELITASGPSEAKAREALEAKLAGKT